MSPMGPCSHNKMLCSIKNCQADVKECISRISFNFGTLVGGLNSSPQASIKMKKVETMIILNSIFRPLPKFKIFFRKHILKARFMVFRKYFNN